MSYTKVNSQDEDNTSSQRGCCACVEDLLGVEALYGLHPDAITLIVAKSIRMFSFGFLSVMLVVYLQEINLPDAKIGLLFMLTLLGDMGISLLMTSHADKWGRKQTLIWGAFLSVFTGVIFSTQTNFWVLLISAIIGVISPSGNECGPFMAIELSGLSQVTPDGNRTKLMAWYNLFSCFSSALGALFTGALISLLQAHSYSLLSCYRVVMALYSVFQLLKMFAFTRLSPAIEVPIAESSVKKVNPVSLFLGLHKSKGIVVQLSVLFMIDSFAGAFILQSLVSAWFYQTYKTPSHRLGEMIFFCNIVAGVSALFAAKLADNIGLIMTMVVTHLPSNVLVILVPLMPNENWAIIMLCLRYCISQMDVPTRNAYVQGVVEPDERSAANGVTNVVRSLGASLGPFLSELLYAKPQYANYPFYIAGVVKIIYDLLLVGSFNSVKPPEEVAKDVKRAAAAERATEELELKAREAGYGTNKK